MKRPDLRLVSLLVTCGALLLAGCTQQGSQSTEGDDPVAEQPVLNDPFTGRAPDIRELASGANSGITDPFQRLIKDQAEWEALWAETNISSGNESFALTPPPEVDFENEWVVAVGDGERSNACWSVRVTQVSEGAQHTDIEFTTVEPAEGADCAEETVTPYHYVAIPHVNEPVKFKNERQLESAEEAQSTTVPTS